jgi:hypothetical protein
MSARAVTSEIASVNDDANAPRTAVSSFWVIRRRAIVGAVVGFEVASLTTKLILAPPSALMPPAALIPSATNSMPLRQSIQLNFHHGPTAAKADELTEIGVADLVATRSSLDQAKSRRSLQSQRCSSTIPPSAENSALINRAPYLQHCSSNANSFWASFGLSRAFPGALRAPQLVRGWTSFWLPGRAPVFSQLPPRKVSGTKMFWKTKEFGPAS